MTPKQALAVLAANDTAAKGSFVYQLHERDNFDRASFWKLFTAMTIVTGLPPAERGLAAQEQAFHVYEYILKSAIYHYNPNDSSRLRRFPQSNLYGYLDRLEQVFTPVIRGVPGRGWMLVFSDGLKNPHQAVLDRLFKRRTNESERR
jgi:hypothetical protein